MEAKDLRIGNYIYMGGNVCSVMELHSFDNVIAKHIKEFETWDKDEGLKPIPLTEEWLLKFRFKENKKYKYFTKRIKDCNFVIHRDYTGELAMCDIDLTVRPEYVHSLQNLYFVLTGEELTIGNE